MINWKDFSEFARSQSEVFCARDEGLLLILSCQSPPIESTDKWGRPLVNSCVIRQHPDTANYRRILITRQELALSKGDSGYASYATKALNLLMSMPKGADLFIVLIATEKELYEYLFVPSSRTIMVSAESDFPHP